MGSTEKYRNECSVEPRIYEVSKEDLPHFGKLATHTVTHTSIKGTERWSGILLSSDALLEADRKKTERERERKKKYNELV